LVYIEVSELRKHPGLGVSGLQIVRQHVQILGRSAEVFVSQRSLKTNDITAAPQVFGRKGMAESVEADRREIQMGLKKVEAPLSVSTLPLPACP
jgi:hypothetical protein